MAEKLDIRLTLNADSRVMLVATADNTLDTFDGIPITFTSSSVETIVTNEVRFKCTIRDGYVLDTVTNTNEHFVVRCITDNSFVYTWADTYYHTDIIDTITISTRAINDEPSVIGPNTNLNITTLANTKWEFTNIIDGYSIIELVPSWPSDYYESSTTLFNISYTFDGTTYNCLHVWSPPSAERWDGDIVYNSGWNTTVREITFIGGNDATDESLLNYMKSNATLISSGDSGDGGDEPEGGDTPSTPTIGPNAQLTEFLTGIADAIREKTGTSDPINPQDFATTIAEMQTGGNVESNPDEMLKAMVEGTILTFNVSTISSIGSNAFTNSFLIDVNLPTCTTIGTSAFTYCSNLLKFNGPMCTSIGYCAFQSCYNLIQFSAPELSYIGEGAFSSCSNFTLCSFPKCSFVGQLAFAYTKISNISLPQCTSLSRQAFAFCNYLTTVSDSNFPLVTTFSDTFTQCSSLESVNLTNLSSTYGTFYGCSKLANVSLPNCSSIGYNTFYQCYSLSSVYIPNCTYISYYGFYQCSAMTSISIPKCSYIGSSAFYNCYKLSSISLPVCSYIGSRAFYYCSALSQLYLMSTSVVSIHNSQAFMYTPMQYSSYLGYFGSIYVPASLLASYKANTYWSYYSSRFVGV